MVGPVGMSGFAEHEASVWWHRAYRGGLAEAA